MRIADSPLRLLPRPLMMTLHPGQSVDLLQKPSAMLGRQQLFTEDFTLIKSLMDKRLPCDDSFVRPVYDDGDITIDELVEREILSVSTINTETLGGLSKKASKEEEEKKSKDNKKKPPVGGFIIAAPWELACMYIFIYFGFNSTKYCLYKCGDVSSFSHIFIVSSFVLQHPDPTALDCRTKGSPSVQEQELQ